MIKHISCFHMITLKSIMYFMLTSWRNTYPIRTIYLKMINFKSQRMEWLTFNLNQYFKPELEPYEIEQWLSTLSNGWVTQKTMQRGKGKKHYSRIIQSLWRDEDISISLSGGGCEIPESHWCKNNGFKFILRIESPFPSTLMFIFWFWLSLLCLRLVLRPLKIRPCI